MDPFSIITSLGGGFVGYAVVLGLLLLCGLGVPVPEDIILVSGGYIASVAGHSRWPMALTGLVGIIGGDSIIFFIGRRFGIAMAEKTFLRRYLTPDRLASVDALFRRHGHKIICVARFMPGVRAVTFFSSGAIGVPWWKFALFDGLAALISAPLWVVLGYNYGRTVVAQAKQWQGYILGTLAVVAVVYLLVARWRSRRRASKVELALPVATLPPVPVPPAPRPAANERV